MSDLNELSEQLLLAVKMQVPTYLLVNELISTDERDLKPLKSDEQKLAFWLNIYNAFYQILAANNPSLGKKIFAKKQIQIGQQVLSLDDIEHGILRLGKHKYSLGFLHSIWKYRSLKKLRPLKLDYRIHFALNCGAVSCPPIAFYSAKNIYHQLDMASINFIETNTIVDQPTRILTISRLFLWFYKDFGGYQGIIQILGYHLNEDFTGYKLMYNSYDWTARLGAFE